MYIVAIAWLFVVILLAITQDSIVAGLLNLFFWGLVPLGLLLWIVGTPARHRRPAQTTEADGKNDAEPT